MSWCVRIHDLDVRAEPGPECLEPLDRFRIGALRRRENAPAVFEQLGKARVGPRMLGARYRVRRHEMHVLRQMLRHITQDRAFYRADIRHDRARLEHRRDLCGYRSARADRDANNDEIGALGRLGIGRNNLVGEFEFGYALARRLGPGRCRNRPHETALARGTRDRRADQSNTDQRKPLEQGRVVRHGQPRVRESRKVPIPRGDSPLPCRRSCVARWEGGRPRPASARAHA